ncbi:MAG: hypothetical protein SNJ64_04375, partial [Endomicrobiia bacterium]
FAVHREKPGIIVAASAKPTRESHSISYSQRVYYSEDYGKTWQDIRDASGFTKILNSKKNPDEFYILKYGNVASILKSSDGGKTWSELSRSATKDNFETNPALDMALDNNNNLFVLTADMTPLREKGVDRDFYLGESRMGKIFVSTDNVESFSSVIICTASFQTDPFSYEFVNPAPWKIVSGSNTIVVAAVTYSTYTAERFYAIYVATSTQESVWEEERRKYNLHPPDLSTWTCRGVYFKKISTSVAVDVGFSIAVSPDGQKIYFYDPQKRKVLISTFTSEGEWSEFYDWSTGFLDGNNPIQTSAFVIDPKNPDNMFIADQSRYGVLISTDSGKTWSPANNGVNALVVYDGCKGPDGVLYVLTRMAVYKSVDGTKWTEVFSTTTLQGNIVEFNEGTIVSPKKDLVIVAADGYVYRSEDGGSSWEIVLVSSFPPAKSIVFRNDNSGVGYIAFREPNPAEIEGYKTKRKYIYKTTDWGKTWSPLDFESMSVQHLAIHPKEQNVLYASLGEFDYLNKKVYFIDGFKKITDSDTSQPLVEEVGDNQPRKTVPTRLFINPDNPNIMYGAITGDPLSESQVYGNFAISYNGGKGWGGHVRVDYPFKPGELRPWWEKNIRDIKYSSGILYWVNDDGIFALIDNTTEVKWLAKTSDIGTTKCLILGSLYTGTSTGLYKLTRLPTQLDIKIDKPQSYTYPNPCDLSKGQKVTLKYLAPQGKDAEWLKISIYNLAGELVYEFPEEKTTLVGGFGYYYEWDGKNQSGKTCARGVYIAVFESNLGIARTKLILVK